MSWDDDDDDENVKSSYFYPTGSLFAGRAGVRTLKKIRFIYI